MAVENKYFEIGETIKVKDSAWDEYAKELQRFGFTRHECYEVSGVYNQGATLSIKGSWSSYYSKYFELAEAKVELPKSTTVKSDGGSSSYYELTITNKAGETIKCETGDVIRALVGNDFDFGNCVKALRRMYLASLGMGKEGTNIPYDCNKIRYFISEIERVNK